MRTTVSACWSQKDALVVTRATARSAVGQVTLGIRPEEVTAWRP